MEELVDAINATHPVVVVVALVVLTALDGWSWRLPAAALALGAVVVAAKVATARLRPDRSSHDSFPSGHAAFAAFVAAAVFARGARSKTTLAAVAAAVAIAWAVAAGEARVAANRHHRADVLVGWALGAAVVGLL
jgi:membrane-associated phospholipid phosphatase